jgi:histidinol-phosphatase (PHP family)
MIRTDFHIHTTLSSDATGKVNDMVQRAIDLGLEEIAITDHADYNPLDKDANPYDPQQTYAQTLAARQHFGDRIIIRHGVELGEPHMFVEEIKPVRQIPLDVIIGSVHFIVSHGVHADFFDVYKPAEGIRDFFDFTLAMVREADIDIMAHLDYFDRYTTQRNYPPYQPDDFKDQIVAILKTIIDRGIAMEVNSSGYRSQAARCFPHPTVLGWYRELGGRLISIGSDAHKPEQLGFGFDQAGQTLLELGFTEYQTFAQRKPVTRQLTA